MKTQLTQDELMRSMAELLQVADKAITTLMPILANIAEIYDKFPDDLKMELAGTMYDQERAKDPDNTVSSKIHFVDVRKNKVDILHVAGCKGECEFYQYIRDTEDLPIKPGKEYEAKYLGNKWVFEEMNHGKPK